MIESGLDFYMRRAREEGDAAARAGEEAAAQVHRDLAQRYSLLAEQSRPMDDGAVPSAA